MLHQPEHNPRDSEQSIPQTSDSTASIQDDLDGLQLATPSSALNERPGRRSPRLSAKKMSKWKPKGKTRFSQDPAGECFLLDLPQDVLTLLLCKLAPKSLLALSATCRFLHQELENETIWRHSYVNHYLWDGAFRSAQGKADVQVLVQGCNGPSRGWRQESLSRESMLNRWTASKANHTLHLPNVGLIRGFSLFYPQPTNLSVPPDGKSQPATPTKSGSATPQPPNLTPVKGASSVGPTPPKLTHRQKYEALLAASTRPAPYVLSAGLDAGAVVRSDPLSGKVSKGYWGPDPNANFHLRTRLNGRSSTSAVFVPTRTQNYSIWGLFNGTVAHTVMQSKHSSAPGTRANSINTPCTIADTHEGQVSCVWAQESADDATVFRFVSGGADGRVKYWQLNNVSVARGGSGHGHGKRSTASEPTSILSCLFTSEVKLEPFANRSEEVQRRQGAAAEEITVVRCDSDADVVCGITGDGDLRVWLDCSSPTRREIRIDAGSEKENGPVITMELSVQSSSGRPLASVLVHHLGSPVFHRYDIEMTEENPSISTTTFVTPDGTGILKLQAYLEPAVPISLLPQPTSAPPIIASPNIPTLELPSDRKAEATPQASVVSPPEFGRLVIAGDSSSGVHIWSWDRPSSRQGADITPLRSWDNFSRKITAIDMSCGIVAIGSSDGYIKVYDPLPHTPVLLRSFRASHLSPADVDIASSDAPHAPYYTPNKILLDNDMLVAAIGHKVFAWRAGNGKSRQAGGKGEKKPGSKAEGRSHGRTMDLRSLHAEAADDQAYMEEEETGQRISSDRNRLHDKAERQQMAVLDDLGLEGDEALQYALMLSMEDQNRGEDAAHEYLEDELAEFHHQSQWQ
ncbi:hypothetical protein BD324DRAFT_620221 [Kockovaella imperatae]|uniref:F-box domain-containing protein n=1 Tax=Kockovaella imperatae TaxID=4999 RepID=A0A1Y1UL94_9TREE|nr:hypothetical protein BD324DRAFT_620221 [Kockovaella imperatae]ORX38274.1 hypothetical protein BD324DRAFT_620221 [Kockovaella imperatae]